MQVPSQRRRRQEFVVGRVAAERARRFDDHRRRQSTFRPQGGPSLPSFLSLSLSISLSLSLSLSVLFFNRVGPSAAAGQSNAPVAVVDVE